MMEIKIEIEIIEIKMIEIKMVEMKIKIRILNLIVYKIKIGR